MTTCKLVVLTVLVSFHLGSGRIVKPAKKKASSDLIPIPDHLLHDNHEDDAINYLDYDDNESTDFDSSLSTPNSVMSSTTSDPMLLPMELPKSSSKPIFLKEPQDAYVVKNKPAKLHCRVAHALTVHFQCNSEIVQPSKLDNHVEPETGVRYVEASVDIQGHQVEEYFGEYHCACVATSNQESQMSRYALVAQAYLRKQFETPPYSQHKALGDQVEMRCFPPKGVPNPELSWTFNGQEINPKKDSNFIFSGAGHLIIVRARLQDSGNYTCVAKNFAATRQSPPASLKVYVDGAWSEWSPWSPCQGRCGHTKQRRNRVCANPAPANGGRMCPGSSFEKRECHTDQCEDPSSGWSQWSSWSSCNPECFQHRSRECKSSNRDKYCSGGTDLESRNCTDGFCQSTHKLVMYGQVESTGNQATDSSSDSNLVLYIIFGIALLVFIAVILIIVKMLYIRKGASPNGYTLTSTDYGYGSDESKKASMSYAPPGVGLRPGQAPYGIRSNAHPGQVVPATPATTTTVCYEYSYPDSNSNHSKSGFLRPESEHHYEQPMVVFPTTLTSSSRGSEGGHSTNTTASSSAALTQSEKVRPCKSTSPMSTPGMSQSNSNNNGNFITSTPLPSLPSSSTTNSSSSYIGPFDPKFTTWATISASGARLTVPDCGVSLTIPPGALNPGQNADLFVSVLHHPHGPTLGPHETLLSPLVACGPKEEAMKLKKPVIVSLPHCASLRHGNWSVSLIQHSGGNTWAKIVTLGQETLNTPVYTQLDLATCHVLFDPVVGAGTVIALTGESAPSGPATKSIRLAAFAQENPPPGASELPVRLYCLPDTNEALAFVSESEKRYNGKLLDAPASVLFQDNRENLCVNLEELGSNWTVKGADYLEVPFCHIWNTANTSLHCSFILKRTDNAGSVKSNVLLHNGNGYPVRFTLSVSQRHAGKAVMTVSCDLANLVVHQQSHQPRDANSLETSSSKFRLSQNVLHNLSCLLDPPTQQGNDWRMLAERLNVNRYVTFFATRPSPTEAILTLWEARNRELLAVSNLINVLRGMGRFDAAALLERADF